MKKNFKTHFLAVFIAGIFSYGLYLTIIAPGSTNLSADILGIQKGDVVSSDILIEQFDEYVTFSANRTMDEMRSLHILVMYDDEYVDAGGLSVESSKAVSQSFERNQGVIVVTTPQGIQANDQLFTLQGILKSDDLIIADINATLDDGSSERLLFSQPVE